MVKFGTSAFRGWARIRDMGFGVRGDCALKSKLVSCQTSKTRVRARLEIRTGRLASGRAQCERNAVLLA